MDKPCELWAGGPLFRQAEHFRLSTDCVLLADFARLAGVKHAIDLGCASGAIALLLLARSDSLRVTGLEILEDACALARVNMSVNGFDDRAEIVCGDIRRHRELFKAGSFDLVISNPPYFPRGSGAVSPDRDRAAARGESECELDDVCTAAAFLCRTGGSVCFVHKPERLAEVFAAMSARGIEPKRLRTVQHLVGSAPNLVLIEGKRGGKPGLKIEAPLILHAPDGGDSEEIKRIYHR